MQKIAGILKIFQNYMKKPVFWPFLICFSYWIYLFFTSHMHISCDAIAYESTGRLLQEKGWLEFFKTGPHREPFYPFLVSLSMLIGKHIQTSYHAIITIFQLLILLITQLLTLKILRILKINNLISALVILYLGLSPAIVNSAFSLFSEIAVYPFILSLILLTFYAWKSFNKSKSEVLLLAGASGILFSLTILNKAIFEIIIPLFIISVFLLSLTKRKKKIIINAFIYLLLTGTIFSSIIFAYKHANKEFNGNFVVTGRGDLKLYGTAVRRTQELTGEDFLVALAYIPGEGFCKNIFGQEKCSYWGFEKIDSIGFGKLAQIKSSGKNSEDAAKETIALAIKETIKNPLQYMVFAIMEGAKMLFWESTNIGFVSYPDSLSRILPCCLEL